MSLFFNMLSRLVIVFLQKRKVIFISWLQSPSAFILEPKKRKSVTVSIVSPYICHEVMGLDAMIFVFWMLSFKPDFSFSSFSFIKRLFSSSLPSAIAVVSSAYMRLLTTCNPPLSLFLPVFWMSPINAYQWNHRKGGFFWLPHNLGLDWGTLAFDFIWNSILVSERAVQVVLKCHLKNEAILAKMGRHCCCKYDTSAKREMLSSSSGTNKLTKINQAGEQER